MKDTHNWTISKVLIATFFLSIFLDILCLAFSINDIFYLQGIITGEPASDAENYFFVTKNQIEHWATIFLHIFLLIIFIIWSYKVYRNIYRLNIMKETAPTRPALVPLFFIAPLFNLLGPYLIIKFIWRSYDLEKSGENNSRHRTVSAWWLLFIFTLFFSRFSSNIYDHSEFANEYLTATYYYIALYILSIYLVIRTMQIVKIITLADSTVTQNIESTNR